MRIRLGWLCILTLPVCVAVTVELCMSFFVADYWSYVPQDRLVLRDVSINRGRIIYTQTRGKYYSDDGQRGWQHEFDSARYMSWLDQTAGFTTTITFAGFAYRDAKDTGFRVVVIPFWPIVLLSAIPTALWIFARRSPK
jgi:hypothetical protein